MQFMMLYFLIRILLFLGMVDPSPIPKYGAQYAQMVSRVSRYMPCPHQNRAHMLPFADSSESSSGHRTSRCLFPRLPGQGLSRWPKMHPRQTNHMLAVKAPHMPGPSTTESSPRVSFGTSPLTYQQSHLPGDLRPESVLPGAAYPEPATTQQLLVPLTTTPEPRGDA